MIEDYKNSRKELASLEDINEKFAQTYKKIKDKQKKSKSYTPADQENKISKSDLK